MRLLLALGFAALLPAQEAKPPKPLSASPNALFLGEVPQITLTISPEGMLKLAKDPREYVECSLREPGGKPLEKCLVKLKGSAGSFRQINDGRPGFSLRTDKTLKSQEFRGLSKFQLNNCAQDGTMLHERMAGEMARAAGVPASRCTHAYLTLNGKVQGTYVLKEGFNKEFLAAFFANTKGHLYDGGFVKDVGPDMEVDRGDPKDNVRLIELIGAAAEGDPVKRTQRLEAILDVDAYLRHLAMENIFCHWDGYSFNRNNYRIYEDPDAGKFHFILHGMDQVFGQSNWYAFRPPGANIANAVWADPALRARYRQQFFNVYEKVFRRTDWSARTIQVAADLSARYQKIDPAEAKAWEQRGREAAGQFKGRLDEVRGQLEDATKLQRAGGTVPLARYHWQESSDKGHLKVVDFDKRSCFYLKAAVGAENGGDFRLSLSVSPGRYRFNGYVRTSGVVGDKETPGARLRISGDSANPANPAVVGTQTSWRTFSYDFTVSAADPTLIVELRARSGEAWFDRNTLTLTRLP